MVEIGNHIEDSFYNDPYRSFVQPPPLVDPSQGDATTVPLLQLQQNSASQVAALPGYGGVGFQQPAGLLWPLSPHPFAPMVQPPADPSSDVMYVGSDFTGHPPVPPLTGIQGWGNQALIPGVPCAYPPLGPYDVVELRVTSLHEIPEARECVRVISVAAGESLHNIYRVAMTALNQREDRARLVYHAWVLPSGRICGNGPRPPAGLKFPTPPEHPQQSSGICNDRDIFLNELPLAFGMKLELVFGKCIYEVKVTDILHGLTDEQDLIWTPRVCRGSYGSAVPFDLCYSPSLFFNPEMLTSLKQETTQESLTCVGSGSPFSKRLAALRPLENSNAFLSGTELDEINSNLSKMRFIRQNSQIRPLLRKHRPEDFLPNPIKRRRWFRLPIRRFFYLLWSQQTLDVSCVPQQVNDDPSSIESTSWWTRNCAEQQINTFYNDPIKLEQPPYVFTNYMMTTPNQRYPRCRVSRRSTDMEGWNGQTSDSDSLSEDDESDSEKHTDPPSQFFYL